MRQRIASAEDWAILCAEVRRAGAVGAARAMELGWVPLLVSCLNGEEERVYAPHAGPMPRDAHTAMAIANGRPS